jgi:DNA repair protein NreA
MRLKAVRFSDIEQYPTYFKLTKNVKEDFFGSSPAPFIGRYGYPNINVGLLAPQQTEQQAWLHDAPRHWATNNFNINTVADLRFSLINSRSKANIKTPQKISQLAQEVGLAKKPVDIEIHLKKKPKIQPLTDRISMPMGPAAQIKSARITENPKIPTKVQRVHDDIDLKANQALQYLYKHNFDENILTKIISTGSIGIDKNRKLVPTRWSITAVDDQLGKEIIKTIKQYSETDCQAYFGSFYGNYFLILTFPDIWSYELFEMYLPKTTVNPSGEIKYTTDHEFYEGRKTYAHTTAGGYYASRLPILEKLKRHRRQATILVLRFITDEYSIHLGVWVVREAVRKAMSNKPLQFASKELMIQYAKRFIKTKFNFNLEFILNKSKLLQQQKQQRKLMEFI